MKHKPYKMSAAEKTERRKHHIGHMLPDDPAITPPVFEPKSVTTNACVICGLAFTRFEAVCNFCGACQYCGGHAGDKYSNICLQCGNHADQPRIDELGETIIIT